MQDATLTEFSGVSGRVLSRSVSVSSLITGIVLGLLLLAGNFVLAMAKAPNASLPFTQIVTALALARFALNGIYGEWDGTIFSGVGGSWAQVAQIAGRYLALTAIWLLPMLFMGMGMQESMVPMSLMASGKVLWFAVLYVLGMTLAPPVFLIVAVSAESFAEIFSPDHWKRVFGGRLADLFAIYVVYVGALGMVVVLSIPLVLLAFNIAVPAGILIGGLSLCLVFGISVNLLGRLSGFYACGDLGLTAPSRPAEEIPSPTPPADDPRPSPVANAGPSPTAPLPVSTTVAQPSVAQAARPVTAAAADPATATPAAFAAGDVSSTVALPAAATVIAATVAPEEEKRPPLLDAPQRIEAAMRRFEIDPESTISALQDLNTSFAPHPHILQSLTLALYRTGHVEPAIEAALQAIPMCFARGHSFLVAELFRELKPHLDRLGLDREQLLIIAGALEKKDDLANAAKAYATVIGVDAGETRAIKGMLQVADKILQEKHKPDAAAKVYRYLLKHCSSSPLAEYMRLGLEDAERKSGHPAVSTA